MATPLTYFGAQTAVRVGALDRPCLVHAGLVIVVVAVLALLVVVVLIVLAVTVHRARQAKDVVDVVLAQRDTVFFLYAAACAPDRENVTVRAAVRQCACKRQDHARCRASVSVCGPYRKGPVGLAVLAQHL